MVYTVLASAVMLLSALMLAVNLRGVAQDTATSLRDSARQFRRGGRLASHLAFGCLWLLIFWLSYG